MNPNYRVQISVGLLKPHSADDIWLRYICFLPFVPRVGDRLRLTSTDDEDETKDITLDDVAWDAAAGMFVSDINDDALRDLAREPDGTTERDVIAGYTKFGFVRLNFPTAQVVR